MIELDHVLIAVADLDAAAADLDRRAGLASVAGGRHEAWGTANRIVPLGATYLELIAIVDPKLAATTTVGRWIERTAKGRPMGWVLRTTDIDAVTDRLGLTAVAGSRLTPDGRTLTWRTAGIDEASAEPSLPFFIEWGPGTPHPGTASVAHRAGAVRLAGIDVTGDGERLVAWLGDVRLGDGRLPVAVTAGEPRVRGVRLATDSGERVIEAV
ncbi:MAG TPA: VOC family protein [Candidatus Limnocylindrales bacterium]|nr:VOC family protein [Candidatus Limnocylindrales bacterium]